MNPYIEKLKTRLLEAEPESVVEMLYEYYREMNRPESKEISKHFSHLNDILAKLPLQEMDEVWYHICDLCIAYQKAFLYRRPVHRRKTGGRAGDAVKQEGQSPSRYVCYYFVADASGPKNSRNSARYLS